MSDYQTMAIPTKDIINNLKAELSDLRSKLAEAQRETDKQRKYANDFEMSMEKYHVEAIDLREKLLASEAGAAEMRGILLKLQYKEHVYEEMTLSGKVSQTFERCRGCWSHKGEPHQKDCSYEALLNETSKDSVGGEEKGL